MPNLRWLKLDRTNLVELPDEISHLKNLVSPFCIRLHRMLLKRAKKYSICQDPNFKYPLFWYLTASFRTFPVLTWINERIFYIKRNICL